MDSANFSIVTQYHSEPSGTTRNHEHPQSPFDAIRRYRADGSEFWSARELMPLLGYRRWDYLKTPLTRAMTTAQNQGLDVDSNFRRSAKITGLTGVDPEDFELTRMAAYLLAMNGDPNKPEVAAAQVYFAAKTREAETATPSATSAVSATKGQPSSSMAALMGMVQELYEQEQRQLALEAEQKVLDERTNVLEAKMAAVEGGAGMFTALAYARENGLPTAAKWLSKLGSAASYYVKLSGGEPGRIPDSRWGSVNVYPVWALEKAASDMED